MAPGIAILATLDTKHAEAEFLRGELEMRGCRVRVVDIGIPASIDTTDAHSGPDAAAGSSQRGGDQPRGDLTREWPGDVTASGVARAAGADIRDLRGKVRRDHAMATMAAGAGRILLEWRTDGFLDGVLGLGGNQGTEVAAAAMRQLEFGVPKYIVSTVASGNVRGYVMDSDIVMAFSVGDLLGGPNLVTETVLRQAAAAVAAMAAVPLVRRTAGRPLVAISALGNTQAAVEQAISRLEKAGVDAVPFHASGASGSAMERLILEGLFDGVLDLTPHELLAELYPADIYAPVRAGRMTAAGRVGLPQVVVPGGLEYHCFGGADTIPPALRDRLIHFHNPNNTNVRASAEEMAAVAGAMASRLNVATGPVAVLIPRLGWSQIGSPGGALHDLEANSAFIARLRRELDRDIPVIEFELAINDDAFGVMAAEKLLALMAPETRQPDGAANDTIGEVTA